MVYPHKLRVAVLERPGYLCVAAYAILSGVLIVLQPPAAIALILFPYIAVIAVAHMRHPALSLQTFIWLLPFHSLIITILLSWTPLSQGLIRMVAAWKELLLITTFLVVLLRNARRWTSVRVTLPDIAALGWLGQIALYLVFQKLVFGDSSTVARLYGARDWLLYLVPYFIGRMTVFSDARLRRSLRALIFVGLVTSVIGIVEVLFVPTSWHILLGVPFYFESFLNLSYPQYLGGLPPNYWTEFDNTIVRRAVSVYLSGQGFALPFLVLIPILCINLSARLTPYRRTILLICSTALLLSITRMTIVVCWIQMFTVLALLRRRRLNRRLAVGLLVVGLGVIVASSSMRTFVYNTLTLRDSSSSARPQQWVSGLRTLVQQPFGMGLGSAGQAAARFGGNGVGTEAGYFKLTSELGLPGLVFYGAWFSGIIRIAHRMSQRSSGVVQALALATCVIAVGMLLNNLTAPPDQSPFVIYIFPWLAGLTVQLRATVRSTAPLPSLRPLHPAPARQGPLGTAAEA